MEILKDKRGREYQTYTRKEIRAKWKAQMQETFNKIPVEQIIKFFKLNK